MASISGSYIAYKTIQLLTRDWEDWDAFDLGLIDDKGNTIKKAETSEEKASMTMFHVMVKNLKKLLEKIPFGRTKIASYVAGLWLIREYSDTPYEFDKYIMEYFEITHKDILLIEENQETLSKGIYYSSNLKQTFYLKEDISPFTSYMGISLYETYINNERFVFSRTMIEKI